MIGIIPAAGKAERMGGIPKFLLPIPGGTLLSVMIEQMTRAGAEKIFLGLRTPFILENLPKNVRTYLVANSATMSETVLAAREKAGDEPVLFGMPDTTWNPPVDNFQAIKNHLFSADVAVGEWYTDEPYRSKRGMCEWDSQTRCVTSVIDKPAQTSLTHGWGILGWKAAFWDCIKPEMPHVGFALQSAIESGQRVDAVFLAGTFYDCGTPEEYFDCICALH